MRQEQEDADDRLVEVAPGVLRVQLPIQFTGLGHVNCYLLEDDRGWAVIDPGLPGPRTWRTLRRRLRQAGARVRDIHTVFVTHSHPDHFGMAERLRLAADAELVTADNFRTWFDRLEPDVLEDPEPGADGAGSDDGLTPTERVEALLSRPTPWGGEMPRPPSATGRFRGIKRRVMGRYLKAPRPTRRVTDGQVLELGGRRWQVLQTPGHCEDHACLWDEDGGVLLSGDHVLPSITPHVSGMTVSDDPLADFIASLDRVDRLTGVELVVPAHGHPFTDLSDRVAAIKRHHDERLDRVREIGADVGGADVETCMRHLFSERAWGNMAESETYAHLEHLRLAERAEAHWEQGKLVYDVAL